MRTILVIEHELLIAQLLLKSLQMSGYQVYIATDKQQALSLLQSQPIDLILSDLPLSERDECLFCQEIRKHSSIPIIFLTTSSRATDIHRCLTLGANDYIVKPFALAEVRTKVNNLIYNYRM